MTTKRHRKKIVRELPPAGTTLQGRFRRETHMATIVEAEGLPGGRGVKLGDDVSRSLSVAAKAITGHPVYGWRFWQAASQDPR